MFWTQLPRVQFPAFPQKSKEKIIEDVEFDKWTWSEEIRQWLENVYRTHLVLASGKPVLQKMIPIDKNLEVNRHGKVLPMYSYFLQ